MKIAKFTSAIDGSLLFMNLEKVICFYRCVVHDEEVTIIDFGWDESYRVREGLEYCMTIIREA